MKTRDAFTLVEVIVVVAILMMLMSLVTIVVGPTVARRKTATSCASNLRQIAALYNLYMTDNDGVFPNGSLMDRFTSSAYDPHNEEIFRCPLTRGDDLNYGRYWDNVLGMTANWSKVPTITNFPDGRPIPASDPELDILYRCLDHAYGGFSRGEGIRVGRYLYNSVGTVLGVRLNGTVQKVAPDSCWEFKAPKPISLTNLWKNCDRPSL